MDPNIIRNPGCTTRPDKRKFRTLAQAKVAFDQATRNAVVNGRGTPPARVIRCSGCGDYTLTGRAK